MESMTIPADYMGNAAVPQIGSQDNDLFQKANDLRVIQEYNREENLPEDIKKDFWALASKSIKLGFWEKEDEADLYFMNNIINVGYIMQLPKHKFTFAQRQKIQMLKLLVYSDYKRGVGMERYKINERTLQAAAITQSIQGSGRQQKGGGGFLGGLGRMFA